MIVANGFALATIDHITRAAGVSKGSFYLHFASKDDLLLALQDSYSETFKNNLEEAVAVQDDWAAKLDACVRAAYDGFRSDQLLHDALFLATTAGEAPTHEPNNLIIIEWLRNLLHQGIAAGEYSIDDPDTTAVLLFGAIHGFNLALNIRLNPHEDQLIRATQRLFRRTAGLL